MIEALSPVAAINRLTKSKPQVAVAITAGLAILGASAIVSTWAIDFKYATITGSVIFFTGLLAIVVTNLLDDGILQKIISYFLALVFIVCVSALTFSALAREQGYINPVYCLLQPMRRCNDVEAEFVETNKKDLDANVTIPKSIEAVPEANFSPSKYTVLTQFAGLITRESVISLNQSLIAGGWKIPGPRGERIRTAAGLNEIRYKNDSDKAAAQSVADAVTAAKLTSSAVVVKQIPIIADNTLELWISN